MEPICLFETKNYFTFCKCDDNVRGCAVIVPGGGYDHTSKLEAFNVAKKFNDNGFHAVVLNYREELISYPEPQRELAYTIDYVRNMNVVDENKIICIGFSAGGHLALSNACYYKEYGYNSRPNLLVLCYPVVSSDSTIGHQSSFKYLLDGVSSPELLDKMSLEHHIPTDLCDVFMWHNMTDESVSVLNSIELMKSLKQKNINFEAHIFPEGCHGMSLSDETTGIKDSRKENKYIARWTEMMFTWINHKFN